MQRRGRAPWVVADLVAVAALLLVAVPAAAADDAGSSPSPSSSPTAPAETTSPPAAEPTPSATSPAATGAPTGRSSPTGSATPGTSSPAPTGVPGPSPATGPGAQERPPQPEPGTDGALPGFGVDDAYWDGFRLLQRRQDELTAAQAALTAADARLAAAQAVASQLAAASQSAVLVASASRLALDRLASDLYQYGSPVTAVTAMLGAPDSFLTGLATASNQDVAATIAVGRATDADAAAALARAEGLAANARTAAAELDRTNAAAAVATARQALRAATHALSELVGGAPQTTIGPDGCPLADVAGTLRGGAEQIGARRLCRVAVAGAATEPAALALTWAFAHLGAAYACGGAGRMLPWRMDCSSLVARAYHEGAGLAVAGQSWAPSTRDMVPWGGASLDPHYAPVAPQRLRPGDLVLYDTGGATYRHVVIYLGPGKRGGAQWMLHTNACGDVAKVEPFWGFPTTGSHTFLGARRVLRLPSDPPLRVAPASTHR